MALLAIIQTTYPFIIRSSRHYGKTGRQTQHEQEEKEEDGSEEEGESGESGKDGSFVRTHHRPSK